MDIRHSNTQSAREQSVSNRSSEASKSEDSARATTEAVVREDTVQLSGDAAALRSAQDAANIEPFDQARVEAIRQAIQEGRYHVDPERLAANFSKIESQII